MIKTMEVHSNEIARDVAETPAQAQGGSSSLQRILTRCPAKWKEGEKTLTPSLDLVGKILSCRPHSRTDVGRMRPAVRLFTP